MFAIYTLIDNQWEFLGMVNSPDEAETVFNELETAHGKGTAFWHKLPPNNGSSLNITIDELAAIIRKVDGNHSLGAGALAESIMRQLKS
jgi:hypothetical protein